ncbi:alpha/beta fold hydrolase [Pseudomonas sp. P5_A2_2]
MVLDTRPPFDGFDTVDIRTDETNVFARKGGTGPGVLLLHGFPQTHLMWRDVAPHLASDFTVVCADLRGYGQSGCPASTSDHVPYSKRAMAGDMAMVMNKLGFDSFSVVGHDRGGRVAYRMALDRPALVARLVALDVLPVADVWERASKELLLGYWPWSLLAQPYPLPERLIAAAPKAVIDNAIATWGSASSVFPPSVCAAYADALRDPEHVHAICEEYRAAAGIDHEHDLIDRRVGRRIVCPTMTLWSSSGPLGAWYEDAGGPLAVWRRWAADVTGEAVEGGHFFAEEDPVNTAHRLRNFLLSDKRRV